MLQTITSQILRSFCFSLFILIPCLSNAQEGNRTAARLSKDPRIEKAVMNRDLETPAMINFSDQTNIPLTDAPAVLKELVQADVNVEFRPFANKSSFTKLPDPKGIHTEKLQQFYKGIKVQHGVFNILMKGEKTEAYLGEYYDLKNINVVPTISADGALVYAKNYTQATKYAWEQAKEARDNETDPLRRQLFQDVYEKLYPKGELVIVKDYDTKNISDLAYRFDIYSGVPLFRAWIYVNAHTGKIMLVDKIIKHVSPDQQNKTTVNSIVPEVAFILSGAAQLTLSAFSPQAVGDTATVGVPTRYAGTRLIGTTNVSGSGNDPSGNGATIVNSTNNLTFLPGQNPWVLIDKRFHGVGSNQSEQTFDLNGVGGLPISAPAYGSAKSFTDLDNNWTTAEHVRGGNNEAENDDFAFDAHWGAGIVYQYWKDIHGRFSFDNANSSIKSYIHSGIAYDNAFWNGSVMTYGDGSFQNGAQAGFAPLTSLDVCGHEIGHGICTFTSDLVYANESGAMNEGYSDIWAAMVENYALNQIDPSLLASPTRPNGFSVWEIGEQIDANDATGVAPNMIDKPTIDPAHTALRYMDFPGKANNPSSYAERTNSFSGGTERWTEQPCTGGPSLANDQCGVHNNSGVLNRMMYLLVAGGSGTVNTRQALVNTAHGAQAAIDLTPYNVTGIGFLKAEKILFLTEQNLTPNATFLQARNTAVVAAEVLYGKCSFEWKQTILAWNAVAIGRSSDTADCAFLPLFSAAISRSSVSEAAPKSRVNCTDAVINLDLSFSVLTPGFANPLTITVTPTGTATNNRDYMFTQTVTTYAPNESGLKKLVLSVYNDAEIEGAVPETIVLAINASAIGFTKDTAITISITDDDFLPSINTGRTNLLSENFNTTVGNALPAGWGRVDRMGSSPNKWITGNNANAYGFNTMAAYVIIKTPLDAGDPVAPPAYDPSAAGEVMLTTPEIDASFKSDIRVKFTFAAMGETAGNLNDPEATLDFGELLYSLDNGVTFERFQGEANRRYAFTNTATVDSVLLPSSFNNKKFRLGFNWNNDDNLAVSPAFIIDDLVVSGGGQKIESETNQGVSEKQFQNTDIYYASVDDAQIIARIRNNNEDLGCVTAFVSEAGTGPNATTFSFGGFAYQRANKVVKITPASANNTADYQITLYATTQELAGMTPSSLKMIKVKDGVALSGSIAPGDAEVVAPVFEDHSAEGYYSFTGSFVSGFSQFVLAIQSGVVAQQLLDFNVVAKENKYIVSSWSVTNETQGTYSVERAQKGSNHFTLLNTQSMHSGAGVNNYSFRDHTAMSNVVYQYRLKITENGRVSYSGIRLASLSGKGLYVDIAPNPSDGKFIVYTGGHKGQLAVSVYDAAGKRLLQGDRTVDGNTTFSVDLTKQPPGVYTMKIQTSTTTESYKLIVN